MGDVALPTAQQPAGRARLAATDRQGVLRIFCFWASNSACVRAPLSSSSLSCGELSVRIGGLLSRGVGRRTDLLLRRGLCGGCLLLLLLMLAVLVHGVRAARDGGGTTAPLASIGSKGHGRLSSGRRTVAPKAPPGAVRRSHLRTRAAPAEATRTGRPKQPVANGTWPRRLPRPGSPSARPADGPTWVSAGVRDDGESRLNCTRTHRHPPRRAPGRHRDGEEPDGEGEADDQGEPALRGERTGSRLHGERTDEADQRPPGSRSRPSMAAAPGA